ncbi:MAG: hypothetical protein ACC653_14305, partial [Gammaproteobacteria bacterium]
MTVIISKKLFLFISTLTFFLVACGEGGVDGTGNKPASALELELFQSCFALSATNECRNRDFNNDGFINYDDLGLLKSATRYDLNEDGYIDISNAAANADRGILNACMGSVEQTCAQADLNGDTVIDAADVSLFNSAVTFDLNKDQRIDILNIASIVVEYSKDFDILLRCLFKMPENDCTASDLNRDKVIDFTDRQLFIDATKFDLNEDSLIDYSNDNTDVLSTTPINEDLKFLSDCFTKDPAIVKECKKADFNNDNIVDIQDFFIFRSGGIYDLDKDGFVDLRVIIESQDFLLFKSCFGQTLVGNCFAADFNSDNVIDITDFFIFRDGSIFDISHDQIVDIYGTKPNSDRAILENCLSQAQIFEECLSSDFNRDGMINADDLSLFLEAVKFDFNNDGYVDYRVRDGSISHDKDIIDKCAYYLTMAPACEPADFNKDGIVNSLDMDEFKATARFDLNQDLAIDLNDTPNNAD